MADLIFKELMCDLLLTRRNNSCCSGCFLLDFFLVRSKFLWRSLLGNCGIFENILVIYLGNDPIGQLREILAELMLSLDAFKKGLSRFTSEVRWQHEWVHDLEGGACIP